MITGQRHRKVRYQLIALDANVWALRRCLFPREIYELHSTHNHASRSKMSSSPHAAAIWRSRSYLHGTILNRLPESERLVAIKAVIAHGLHTPEPIPLSPTSQGDYITCLDFRLRSKAALCDLSVNAHRTDACR